MARLANVASLILIALLIFCGVSSATSSFLRRDILSLVEQTREHLANQVSKRSAGARDLSACVAEQNALLNLTFNHLFLEEASDFVGTIQTMSPNAFEVYSGTLEGGLANTTSYDQSLLRMYVEIESPKPADYSTSLIAPAIDPVGRTLAFLYYVNFTHTAKLSVLPNIPPTGRHFLILLSLHLAFDENDKMKYEVVTFDEAGVLVQANYLCPNKLPVVNCNDVVNKLLDPYGPPVRFNDNYSKNSNRAFRCRGNWEDSD